ncbi:MAG: NifB/NifX family molybdenum-iron cluster-binding protein [Spirochaetes bacterium]|nr:NifB/NifX family molybdenum-iron cluster-binding protein [Spirochaetota bacterium]
MKIAISTDGEYVSAHFGRCPSFTIIQVEEGKLVKKEELENPGHEPGFLPRFLNEQGVECILAGGMGPKAQELFSSFNIKTMMGIEGRIDDVINGLINNTIKGGESLCQPGGGKGYGLDKTGGHCHEHE